MNRRHFTTALALGTLTSPLAIGAQRTTNLPRVGVLRHGSPPDPFIEAFRRGLHELGYIEGKNILIEVSWTEGKVERIPKLAQDLVRRAPDAIMVSGEPVLHAIRKATTTIPVVMATSQNPVGASLVASLARPGGNMTGMTSISPELTGKRLELLKEAFPRVSRIAIVWDGGVDPDQLKSTETAARLIGFQSQVIEVRRIDELASVMLAAQQTRAEALVVLGSTTLYAARAKLAELASRTRLPAMYAQGGFVEAGGLMSYGTNLAELFRRSASFVDRILKGAKPADLPVEQPTKFELVINLKTAKALGLAIPQSILMRADRVIE